MSLFEKSLIGAYCNRLYDLKERQDPFHAKAELKQTAQAKILMSPVLIRKRAHQIVEHAYHQTAHFLWVETTTFVLCHQFSLCFISPPFTLLKITNGSLCHFSFFEYFQS